MAGPGGGGKGDSVRGKFSTEVFSDPQGTKKVFKQDRIEQASTALEMLGLNDLVLDGLTEEDTKPTARVMPQVVEAAPVEARREEREPMQTARRDGQEAGNMLGEMINSRAPEANADESEMVAATDRIQMESEVKKSPVYFDLIS